MTTTTDAGTYTLPELLTELGLARTSCFYHRTQQRVADKYEQVRRAITEIFEHNHRCYGYRRLRAALRRREMAISEKVVRRLMRQEQLTVTPTPRRRKEWVDWRIPQAFVGTRASTQKPAGALLSGSLRRVLERYKQ